MNVEIPKKDGTVESMSISEFSRWMCLVEAFHILDEKAKDLKIDVSNLIKPLAIDDYIKERYPAMLHDVECELKLGNI
jgi:hypothetical protein